MLAWSACELGWPLLRTSLPLCFKTWGCRIKTFLYLRIMYDLSNHIGSYGRQEGCVQGFGGRPEGKRRLGKPGRKWKDNIKMYLLEMGWGGMDWIDFAEDRENWWTLVNALMNFNIARDRSNWFPSFSSITFQFLKVFLASFPELLNISTAQFWLD